MQKYLIEYANNQSFTIEATDHADYISQLKTKFLEISLDRNGRYHGRNFMKEGFESIAID